MSRTNKIDRIENPVEGFISLHGGLGKIGYRKKGDSEMSEIPTPFSFIVLDADCRKIGGKVKPTSKKSSRFNSNLAHFGYGVSEFTVVIEETDKILGVGKWGKIKSLPELAKAQYTQLIYALAAFEPGVLSLVRISLHGRALSAWIEFTKSFPATPTEKDPNTYFFSISGFETKSSEENELESEVPIFSAQITTDPEVLQAADEADANLLQPWFAYYFKEVVPDAKKAGSTDSIDQDPEAEAETEAESDSENIEISDTEDVEDLDAAMEDLEKKKRK